MNIYLIGFACALVLILLINKIINIKKNKNNKLSKFKKKLLSKESNIEKIFSRDDEKTFSDPDININIGLYDSEDQRNLCKIAEGVNPTTGVSTRDSLECN